MKKNIICSEIKDFDSAIEIYSTSERYSLKGHLKVRRLLLQCAAFWSNTFYLCKWGRRQVVSKVYVKVLRCLIAICPPLTFMAYIIFAFLECCLRTSNSVYSLDSGAVPEFVGNVLHIKKCWPHSYPCGSIDTILDPLLFTSDCTFKRLKVELNASKLSHYFIIS